jgi:hypothetical protein
MNGDIVTPLLLSCEQPYGQNCPAMLQVARFEAAEWLGLPSFRNEGPLVY